MEADVISNPGAAESDCWNRIGVWGDPSCVVLAEVIHCRNCRVYSSAGRRLLDRNAPDGYIGDWTELIARPGKSSDHAATSVVVFRVGDEWLALPTGVVREVSQIKPVHHIPHRNNQVVVGVVNIRGELLICVSLGRLLAINKGSRHTLDRVKKTFAERLIMIEDAGQSFVFPVSEIHGNHRFRNADLNELPATVRRCGSSYMKGIFPLGEQHVGYLDKDLVFPALMRCLG
jgi:chemotaxis-related protein WspD